MGNLDVLSPDDFRNLLLLMHPQQKYIDMLGTANTVWQDKIYQNCMGTNNNIAFPVVSKKITIAVYQLVIQNQNGIGTNEFRRTSLGLNLTPNFLIII